MHQVHINKRQTFDLPSRMDELSQKQLRLFMKILTMEITMINKAKLMVLMMSLTLPFWQRAKFQYFYFIKSNWIERADLLFLTQSFEEFRSLTTQKIEKIRCRFVLLYGPESGLANSTLWE
ncbi:hypothetical protein, partial [Belliella pelovolcani]|uniref:hypothetical protein n=1 Tax=Belliella pelovolcani TaxID=529505 RepID=UPI00391D0D97